MSKKEAKVSKTWKNRSFPYVPMNGRVPKLRSKSITEIRGPYYAMVTPTPTYTKRIARRNGRTRRWF